MKQDSFMKQFEAAHKEVEMLRLVLGEASCHVASLTLRKVKTKETE